MPRARPSLTPGSIHPRGGRPRSAGTGKRRNPRAARGRVYALHRKGAGDSGWQRTLPVRTGSRKRGAAERGRNRLDPEPWCRPGGPGARDAAAQGAGPGGGGGGRHGRDHRECGAGGVMRQQICPWGRGLLPPPPIGLTFGGHPQPSGSGVTGQTVQALPPPFKSRGTLPRPGVPGARAASCLPGAGGPKRPSGPRPSACPRRCCRVRLWPCVRLFGLSSVLDWMRPFSHGLAGAAQKSLLLGRAGDAWFRKFTCLGLVAPCCLPGNVLLPPLTMDG